MNTFEIKKGFGSDNHSGIDESILQSLIEANQGHLPSYGTDPITEECRALFRRHFGPDAESFFVFNGTAANVLSLKALLRPYHAIVCSSVSHLNVDECGAPEALIGAKLLTIETPDGKITPDQIERFLIRQGDQHHVQVKAFSITQSTEYGTVYSIEELKALGDFANEKNLFFHMDGARLVNAAASLEVSLKELTTDIGVDVLSFGGTKNALLGGEAVLFLSKRVLESNAVEDFKYVRKQNMQLPSKSRFFAAQFLSFLSNDLWLKNARHANRMAQELSRLVENIPGVEVTQKVAANVVFAKIPKSWVKPLREEYFFYVWDERTFECRWMTTFDTTEKDILGFAEKLKSLSGTNP
jgi:threonine aldolase